MNLISRYLLLAVLLVAVSACGPSLAERKKDAEIHFKLGAVHLNDGNYIQALEELTKAIEKYPDEPSYHNALGLTYMFKGMNAEAEQSIKTAIRLDPDFSEAHVALSSLYRQDRNWAGAIEEARLALGNMFYKTPEYAHYNMGMAYYGGGDYEKALESFKLATSASPKYSPAFYGQGLAQEKLGDTKAAVAAYKQAIRLTPGFIDAYFSLGMAEFRLGNKDESMKAFRRVVEMDPGSDFAKSAREYLDLIK